MKPKWMDNAACRGMNPGYFMPERGDIALVRAAKAICDTCPVKTECREYGLDEHRRTDLDGIFGGLTKHERLKILRTENLPQRRRRYNNLDEMFFKPCGTHAAYIRHLRRKEKPCEKCRQEHARMAAERRAEHGRPSRARTNVA